MGRKISVDSATMMNKGLEVIEAHWLFDLPGARIEVLIHPQSVIHSMVSYADGSVLAQLGTPDMRMPIAHALAFPERVDSGVAPLDLAQIATLTFEKPDFERFPCLALAMKALARRRRRERGAQRGERGRGRGVSGAPHRFHGDRRGGRARAERVAEHAAPPRSTTCSPPTPARAALAHGFVDKLRWPHEHSAAPSASRIEAVMNFLIEIARLRRRDRRARRRPRVSAITASRVRAA